MELIIILINKQLYVLFEMDHIHYFYRIKKYLDFGISNHLNFC